MVHAAQSAMLEHEAEDNGITTDELVLRICSPARRSQVVRLKSRKCSIGSAQNCTLRLASRGIHPVHCLIVRGQKATVIRCWSPDTRINGRSFSDANLNVGDRLAIGPIEFEVLHTGTPHAPEPSEMQSQAEADAPDQSSLLDEQLKSIEEEKQRWEKDLAARRAELDAQRAELDAQRESLQNQREKLAEEADILQNQRRQWETARAQEELRSADAIAHVEQLEKELDAQRAELDAQRESLQKQREKLAEEADILQNQRRQWETARAQEELRSADAIAHVEQLVKELDAQRAELDAQRESLQKQREKPAEDFSENELLREPIADEAPISLENVLSKMGLESIFQDQQPEPSPSSASTPAEQETASFGIGKGEVVARRAASEDNQHAELSLDDYMARLMERVRAPGGSTSTTAPTISGGVKSDRADDSTATASHPASAQSVSQTATIQATSLSTEAELAAKESTGEKLMDISPRGRSPEKVESLSAMRELANVSAKTAIDRYAKRQFLHAARSKLLVAGIGLFASGILLSLWWFLGDRGPVFYGGLVAFLIALFWGFQFAVMSGKVAATKAPVKKLNGISSTAKNENVPNVKTARKEQSHNE